MKQNELPKFIYLGDYVGYISVNQIVRFRVGHHHIKQYGFTLAAVEMWLSNQHHLYGIYHAAATTSNHPDYRLDIDNLEEELANFDFYEEEDISEEILEDHADYIKLHGNIVNSPDFVSD